MHRQRDMELHTGNQKFWSDLWTLFLFGASSSVHVKRARGGAVGWGSALQSGRLLVQFPEFFTDIILPAAQWPLGRLSL
jgi:hypothetical protein